MYMIVFKNIIFPGPEIVWRVHWKRAAGCVSCCLPEHIPSLGDGGQLYLLKCKFLFGAVVAAAAAAQVTASPD